MNAPIHYTGLTWDHPRGIEPLAAAARDLAACGAGIRIDWCAQPLEGFEASPIERLAEAYDLVILDHPCLGEVVANDCFVPMEDLFSQEEREAWRRAAIGPSYESYHYGGKQWALPLDAAAQVCAINPALLPEDKRPLTWSDTLELADEYSMCLSLAGPHALLSFFSICAAIAGDENLSGEDRMFPDQVCIEAYEWLMALYAKATRRYLGANPIAILNGMASDDEVAFCPLVYGYVNYAASGQPAGHRPLAFINAPRLTEHSPPTSTIGGTGLAVSRRAQVSEALLDHIRYLMSPAYQKDFAPRHQGQPSFEEAWCDRDVNRRSGQFYVRTLETVRNSWLRPRHAGYPWFQNEGSAQLRQALDEGAGSRAVIGQLRALFETSREAGGKQERQSHV